MNHYNENENLHSGGDYPAMYWLDQLEFKENINMDLNIYNNDVIMHLEDNWKILW